MLSRRKDKVAIFRQEFGKGIREVEGSGINGNGRQSVWEVSVEVVKFWDMV